MDLSVVRVRLSSKKDKPPVPCMNRHATGQFYSIEKSRWAAIYSDTEQLRFSLDSQDPFKTFAFVGDIP